MLIDMGQVDESFPTCVRFELAERGMSQADLARCTGIDPSTLSKIVTGRRRPSGRQLAAIALKLDIDVREHVGGVLRDQLRAERARVEQLAARCAQLEHLVEQQGRVAETEAEARQQAEISDAARCAELERRVQQAERNLAAEAEARQNAEAVAAARCAELEQRAALAEAKCARLERAERDRASADAAQAERDHTANAKAKSRSRPFEPKFSEPVSVVDDRYGRARAQADAYGGAVGKFVEVSVAALLFRRMSRRADMDGDARTGGRRLSDV